METIVDIAKAGGWPTGRPTSLGPPKVEWALIPARRANPQNARTHSNTQRRRIAAGLRKCSFPNPVPVDDVNMILSRQDRVEAAKLERLTAFPLVRFAHLTDAPMRADVITDKKIAEQVGWDREILAIELSELIDLLTVEGFESYEQIDTARFASDDAPRRRHSGPADGPFLTASPLSGCETVNASGGDEEARLLQTAVASERGNVQ
jgi:hypothetical protein